MRIYASLLEENPELAKEWHPTKNGALTPADVSYSSGKKVWWLKPYDDPVTGIHYDFEWENTVDHRARGQGCPFLAGKKILVGFNDFASRYPELAKEWHPSKNGSLTPADVSYSSGKKVWWLKPYDDPVTGIHYDFEWENTVDHRVRGQGCPFLVGKKILVGFNDFASKYPELASQWNYKRNKKLLPSQVTASSNKSVWWIYTYEDPVTKKHFDFEWKATVSSRVNSPGCPFLSSQRLWVGFNDLKTVRPDLAAQWDYSKNDGLTPQDVMPSSTNHVWWLYPYDDSRTGKHFDFSWKAKISDRYYDSGCPFLSNQRVYEGFNDLSSLYPELAKEYDVERNVIPPTMITSKSNKKVWWKCPYCGAASYVAVSKKSEGQCCPCIYNK
jgi:hypothetical protein